LLTSCAREITAQSARATFPIPDCIVCWWDQSKERVGRCDVKPFYPSEMLFAESHGSIARFGADSIDL
jgi:hypothetical protein